MEPSICKRRRLMLSYVPRRPDLPAIFESLNDDTLTTVLEFVGDKSYRSFGGTNKKCKEIYLVSGMTKYTFLYGYAPLPIIIERASGDSSKLHEALSKGVVLYNRRDVLEWALQKRKKYLLKRICGVAGVEGRSDLLEEVWNNVENEDSTRYYIFGFVDQCAARHGKLDVLKWVENKGMDINNHWCAKVAACHGQLHILQWLKERGLELKRELYYWALDYGGHLHIIKWLHEQGCPWSKSTFKDAAKEGNLDILQWLHEEDCPWPDDHDHDCVFEDEIEPEVLDWLRSNGYGNRIMRSELDDLT